MAAKELFSFLSSIQKQFVHYFNPIGKFYITVQFLCRILIPQFVLDKMFSEPVLVCDTRQLGCEQNCINRFTPMNHQRIWEVELLMIILSLMVFWGFSFVHRELKKRDRKEINRLFGYGKKWISGKGKNRKEIVVSKITRCGYITMLCVRISFEMSFLYIENQLGKHQSQNDAFWQAFNLKESWLCATNDDNPAAQRSLSKIIPEQNRSMLFWTEDWNPACMQQSVTVTCWIPYSRMKSIWLWFMYSVLCFSTCLTFFELTFELTKGCFRRKYDHIHDQLRTEIERQASVKLEEEKARFEFPNPDKSGLPETPGLPENSGPKTPGFNDVNTNDELFDKLILGR